MSNRRTRKSNPRLPAEPKGPLVNIPEAEQWRIIKESGLLQRIEKEPPTASDAPHREEGEGDGLSPFAEEVFNAIMLIIPMSFMLLMMEM